IWNTSRESAPKSSTNVVSGVISSASTFNTSAIICCNFSNSITSILSYIFFLNLPGSPFALPSLSDTFLDLFVDLLLFKLNALYNGIFDLPCFRASVGFDHQPFQSQKRSSAVLAAVKRLQR